MKLIDGDELIELLLSTAITDKQREYSECVQYAVQKMPTVDAVPVVHGHWIPCHPLGDDTPEGYMCSFCHVGGWEKTNFCHHCGARMDGKDGDA